MLYVTFAYAPDLPMVRILRDRLAELDPDVAHYIITDPASPINPADLPSAAIRTGTVPRGGNLNGLPIIAEELATYASLMDITGHNTIIKIDADCYPITLQALTDSTADLTVCERSQPFTPAGMVYKLTRHAVDKLLTQYNHRTESNLWQTAHHYPEDQTIYALTALANLTINLLPYNQGHATGMPDCLPHQLPDNVRHAHFVHCGEPTANGTRISRSHAALRMQILHHAISPQP